MCCTAIIHDLPQWQVTSYGNGLSYEIFHKPSDRDIFFQGDDAARFRDEFDALTAGMPCLDFSDALQYIWNEYKELSAHANYASVRPLERVT